MSRLTPQVSKVLQIPVVTRFMSRHADTLDGALRKVTRGRVSSISGLFFPELVLHSLGAKSGQWRENTLLYVRDEDGVVVVVGTNFGGDSHPAWTYNLLANPGARIVVERTEVEVTARQMTPEEMAPVWPRFDAIYPGYIGYRERIGDSREIRMFRLDGSKA